MLMKKTIISILIILPFLLIVVISLAGRIYGDYRYVDVENISFVAEDGSMTNDNPDYVLYININERVALDYVIVPAKASNKNVTFSVVDSDVCSVSDDGYIVGLIADRTTRVRVTAYNNIYSEIVVYVTDSRVREVELDKESIIGYAGNNAQLSYTIVPSTAVNKNVQFISSDESVCTVQNDGVVNFVSEGEAYITIRTIDGGHTDICHITVLREGGISFSVSQAIVEQNSVDLINYLTASIDGVDAHFVLLAGDCVLNGTTITFNAITVARVKFYVGNNPDENYSIIELIYNEL